MSQRVEAPSSWSWLVGRLQAALDDLSPGVTPPRIEALAVEVFTAMAGPLRRFHTLDHLMRFAPADSVETLAVLYHDVVYWSVDGTWPPSFAGVLAEVAPEGPTGLLAAAPVGTALPFYTDLLTLFGQGPGTVPQGPTNELFSALAFASSLGDLLGRSTTLAVAACIEATIPFRGLGARTTLHQRLVSLGVPDPEASAWVTRAVHLANQDVGDFRLDDPGAFLGGTWNLLPELNPDLRITAVFTIQAYRRALVATDKFFTFLHPDKLFDSWGSEPGDAVLACWKTQAALNLAIARQYLGAKVLASALLEALARETGSDIPLSLFMGSATDKPEARLEALLPDLGPMPEMEPVLFLLEWGRSSSSSFDLTNSPLAAWLYRQISPDDRTRLLALSADLFAETLPPRAYLDAWNPAITAGLIQALAAFVPTRRAGLLDLLGPS